MTDNTRKPETLTEAEARRRRNSRLAAATLAITALGVAAICISATRSRAQVPTTGQTASRAASASSSQSATQTPAATAIRPNTAVTAAAATPATTFQRAQRNPSRISGPNLDTPSPAASAQRQAAPNQSISTSASQTASQSSANRPQIKGPVAIKTALPASTVNWAQAVNLNKRSLTAARAQNPIASRLPQLQIDKTRLPVLLPKAATTLKATEARMVSFGNAYSLSLPQKPGLQIILYGHRTRVAADKGGVINLKRSKISGVAEDVFLSQTEDGWTGSFKRFGVVYTVDVSCDDLDAPECQTDAYLRKAIADLTEVSLGAEAVKEAVLAGVQP